MEESKFDKIMSDIVSSFYMEKLKIPDNVFSDIRNRYVVNKEDMRRPLVKRRRFINYDFRRK